RVSRPEAADRLAALLTGQAQAASGLLRDRRRTAFHWVLLPEALSIAETEDGLRALHRAGIHVPALVVNRVLPDGGPCPVCDRRRDAEREAIAAIAALKPRRDVRVVTAQQGEPRGPTALARIGRELASRQSRVTSPQSRIVSHQSMVMSDSPETRLATGDLRLVTGVARLLFVGGKGGVGKS